MTFLSEELLLLKTLFLLLFELSKLPFTQIKRRKAKVRIFGLLEFLKILSSDSNFFNLLCKIFIEVTTLRFRVLNMDRYRPTTIKSKVIISGNFLSKSKQGGRRLTFFQCVACKNNYLRFTCWLQSLSPPDV